MVGDRSGDGEEPPAQIGGEVLERVLELAAEIREGASLPARLATIAEWQHHAQRGTRERAQLDVLVGGASLFLWSASYENARDYLRDSAESGRVTPDELRVAVALLDILEGMAPRQTVSSVAPDSGKAAARAEQAAGTSTAKVRRYGPLPGTLYATDPQRLREIMPEVDRLKQAGVHWDAICERYHHSKRTMQRWHRRWRKEQAA